MELAFFTSRFTEAAERARDFAAQYVEEELPPGLRFRVRLNQSYDATATSSFVRFLEDSSPERARQLHYCDESQAIAALWREGKIPQWADLSVIGEHQQATLIEVRACGRFTEDESKLYHAREGYPPFHVGSPALPIGWKRGQRFSIHMREECWSPAEIPRITQHSEKIWSLALYTDALDGDRLAALPPLSGMEILEHHWCALNGSALQPFSRFPALRIVRLHVNGKTPFAVGTDDACLALTDLAIHCLDEREWGVKHLRVAAPALRQLTVEGSGLLVLNGELPEQLEQLTIAGKTITDGLLLPTGIDSITLRLSEASDSAVRRLLDGVPRLSSLSLRGTPVGDDFVEWAVQQWALRYLDVVQTCVSDEQVLRVRERFPELKMYPNLRTAGSVD